LILRRWRGAFEAFQKDLFLECVFSAMTTPPHTKTASVTIFSCYGGPATLTGTAVFIVVPLPSWPELLSPQQYAVSPVVTPQLWLVPALTVAKMKPPKTATGTALFIVVPLPSWPELLSPQQYAVPPVVTPQLWLPPALTGKNSSPPATVAGIELFVAVVAQLARAVITPAEPVDEHVD
jgi:hypothetical protein